MLRSSAGHDLAPNPKVPSPVSGGCLRSRRGEPGHSHIPWCLIPGFDGAVFSQEWKEALWARFTMGAPQRQRRSVERYSIVKRA